MILPPGHNTTPPAAAMDAGRVMTPATLLTGAMHMIVRVIIALMAMAASCYAAGTHVISPVPGGSGYVVGTWVADASDGSIPDATISNLQHAVLAVVTDPGAIAPTDNYDIVMTDDDNVDVMGGELANRDTATTEQAVPLIGSAYGLRPVFGGLTVSISNNSVVSATGTYKIYLQYLPNR